MYLQFLGGKPVELSADEEAAFRRLAAKATREGPPNCDGCDRDGRCLMLPCLREPSRYGQTWEPKGGSVAK